MKQAHVIVCSDENFDIVAFVVIGEKASAVNKMEKLKKEYDDSDNEENKSRRNWKWHVETVGFTIDPDHLLHYQDSSLL